MDDWSKESLGLKIGDWITWKDKTINMEDGPAFVSTGMKGKVISLHDGFQWDVIKGGFIPAKALVQFENGAGLLVDQRMKWEKATKP